jgi:ABC-type transporter Mla MlaB component
VLRITLQEEKDQVTLKLEGRIVGPWTAELHRVWYSIGPSLDDKKLSIDLCGVSYIDRDGRGILADMYRQTHAHFKANTPLTRYFADEVRASNFEISHRDGAGNGRGKNNEKGAPK